MTLILSQDRSDVQAGPHRDSRRVGRYACALAGGSKRGVCAVVHQAERQSAAKTRPEAIVYVSVKPRAT